MLDSETENRRTELFGDLEKEKGRLNGEIENLRAFEREYRSRLKSYFSQQLAALDGEPASGGPARAARRPSHAQAAAVDPRRGRRAAAGLSPHARTG